MNNTVPMSAECIFCRIGTHAIPTEFLYEDDQLMAFRDIHPSAPVHVLVVPKRHLASLADLTPADQPLLGMLLDSARQLAEQLGIDRSGYRVVINTGPDGGQVVDHLHVHLLGGGKLATHT